MLINRKLIPQWPLLRVLLVSLICLLFLTIYYFHKSRPPYALYTILSASELQDSQTSIRNSSQKKYVKFKQLQGAGFNNQAQEILLFHHLALQTSRIYVYQPFIWRPRGEKATVPLSAFLRGPTRGSISEVAFNEVCPEDELTHLTLVSNERGQWDHAKRALEGKERCVVVDDWLFNWNYLASPGIHDIWPSYQKYLTNNFEWSTQVLDIVDKAQSTLNLRPNVTTREGAPYMALHLRRGDFETHCQWLKDERTGFTTWSTLPILANATLSPDLNIENGTSIYEHCYPSLHRILEAITHQAHSRPHMRTLHILHDGAWDHPLVYLQFYKLKEALMNREWAKNHDWKGGPMLKVTQSADVPINWGESDWKVCVDMELARRAEVFIGNGYSSLSSQIISLRLGSDGGKVEDITLM